MKLYNLSKTVEPVTTYVMNKDHIFGPNPEFWEKIKTLQREAAESFPYSLVEVCEVLNKRNSWVKGLPGDSVFTKMAVCRILDIRLSAKKLLGISEVINKLATHVDGHRAITVDLLTSLIDDAFDAGDAANVVCIT